MLSIAWAASAAAQLPVPQLQTLFPPGAQAGARVQVVITGASLEDVRELRFSGVGLRAEPVREGGQATPVPNQFVVTVAADAAPRRYDAWVVGRHGVSNLRSFRVGVWPEVIDVATNSMAAAAQVMAVPGTVFGKATANAADFFRVRASGGGRALVIRCEGPELDSRIAPALEVFDSSGVELGRVSGHGAFWQRFAAPMDVVIRVHDFLFRGGEEYVYRLTIHEGPHVDRVFPPVVQAGQFAALRLYGVNLPGTPALLPAGPSRQIESVSVEVRVPDLVEEGPGSWAVTSRVIAGGLDRIAMRLDELGPGWSQSDAPPILLGRARDPVVVTSNAVAGQVAVPLLNLPSEWVGVFPRRGQTAAAEFDAAKGDAIWVETISHRLGLPTDPQLTVSRVVRAPGGGDELKEVRELQDSEADFGGPEFRTDSRDCRGRIDIAEAGRYRLQLRDLFAGDAGNGQAAFRVQLRKVRPDFRLCAVVSRPPPANRDQRIASPWSVVLRRGETLPVRVLTFRQDGFDGPIELKAVGLPSGVSAGPLRIEPGKSLGMLVLTAATNAVAWEGSIRIAGEASIAGEACERLAGVGVVAFRVEDYNNEAIPNRLAAVLPMAVHGGESAPVRVFPRSGAPLTVGTNGKVQIPIAVEREAGFAARLALKAVANGMLEKQPELVFEPGTNQAVLEVDLARTPLPPGRQAFTLGGEISGKYKPFVPGLEQAREDLKIREAELAQSGEPADSDRRKAAESARKAAADRVAELEKQAAPTEVFLRLLSEPIVLEVVTGEAGT